MTDSDEKTAGEAPRKRPEGEPGRRSTDRKKRADDDDHHDNRDEEKENKEDKDDSDDEDDDEDNDEDQGDDKPSKLKDPKVRIGLIVFAVLVVLGLAIWLTYYWTTGRYLQSTDDAFLQADQVIVSSKIAGYVEEVFVKDNETVKAGQPLLRISRQDSRAAAEQARAQVAQGKASVLQVEAQIQQQRAQIDAADAQVAGARSTLKNAQTQVDRYTPLVELGAQSAEELTQLRQARDQAAAQLAQALAQRRSAARQVDTLRAQTGVALAQVDAAEAQARKADSDLSDTLVSSSIDGRIGNKTVEVGQFVQPTTRLMSVVPVQDLYLVANFKETQITLMRVGQPVTIEVDALGGEQLQGTVESFAPGTGAQFALLPPQNATGNFTKIVQRVPVRIHIDDAPEAGKVLLPGLSAVVTVDTIGSKAAKKRIEREADRRSDEREAAHDQAVDRDRSASQPGPGQ
ncbi:MAG: HlyD family secretion protein [Pseudomonadota bacterium]|nr:HlyD family secretion protein [Pseudomonadota bacterium]